MPGPDSRTSRRRVPGAVAVTVGVIALAVLHAVLVRPVHGFMLSDTTGYLANARWLAGEAGTSWQGPTSFYHPAWSLLASPLYRIFTLPRDVQVGVIVLNAALAVATFPASYLLGRRAFRLPPGPALAGAAIAATYPAVLLLSGYEWGEALYQLLFVGFVLAVAGVLARPTTGWAVAVGALAAALNATHPRGLGVVAVAGALLVYLALRKRLPRAAAAAGVVTLVALFAATRLVNATLLDAIYAERSAAVEGDVLGRLTDPKLLWGAVKAALGQSWYLTVATFGLVPLGALWLATTRRIPRVLGVTTLAAAAATLAASALMMSDGTRVDHMVYGRYVEGFVPVLLVAGAAGVVAWRTQLPRLLAGAAAIAAVLAAAVVVVRGGDAFGGDVMPLNVTGILVYRDVEGVVDVARVTLLALVATGVVAAVARWRALAGLGLVALLFAGSAVSVEARTLRPFDRTWDAFTRIPEAVRELDAGPVSYDRGAYDAEAANFYQVELSDIGVRFVPPDHEPTTDLVISGERWPAGEARGARLVTVETGPVYQQGLWVLPGALQDRLAAEGALLPTETSAPLPEAARRPRIVASVPAAVDAGSTSEVEVEVTHAGGGAAWLPVDGIPGVVQGSVRVGARWHLDDGPEEAGGTADLDRVLHPGDRTTTTLRLAAPEEPGRYRLSIGLRQEGIAWFPDDRTFTVEVR